MNFFKFKRNKSYCEPDSRLLTEAEYTVVDTELTGLNSKKDSIVSIGCIRMNGSRIHIKEDFYRLVKPHTELSRESILVHGITPSEVENESDTRTVLKEFCDYCGSRIIVGHFICIDIEFINKELKAAGMPELQNRTIDTFAVYEWMRKRITGHACFEMMPGNNALYEISKCFGIPITGAHNSEMDAFITAQLFQRFISYASELGVKTVEDLITIGDLSNKGGNKFCRAEESANF
ncbi:MAG: 3'-5' exonuclease [Nitrospirae bacterium]|nr:3'-5' exonuclease [Nitrospirota bacterium]